ncbi:SOS response-associated peptidase [Rathayibacter oskolensis]|uniref:SOS response-associated peptidase n=1 Tax=Rathayibacter oskolensis TaxID=1891671 RepID=UPI00265E3361|nr:SOS response-associated peptidase [Rathayibacter oskolensis]WKK72218.1 SOS response-associated peptidase [Rathayibacter oskolensis]
MCGRFAMDSETDELIREFVAAGGRAADWAPDFSVAPTDSAPIVRERLHDDAVEREIELASWGFTPSWSKGKGPSPINARLETVASNGLFRGAFAKQRAIVPMRGYYEWEAREDGKQPFFLHGDEPILAAAGLYTARKTGDEWQVSFTIITREARDASGDVHDRMPVFLTPDVRDEWLNPPRSRRRRRCSRPSTGSRSPSPPRSPRTPSTAGSTTPARSTGTTRRC